MQCAWKVDMDTGAACGWLVFVSMAALMQVTGQAAAASLACTQQPASVALKPPRSVVCCRLLLPGLDVAPFQNQDGVRQRQLASLLLS